MFEQTLEEMTASVWLDQREAAMLDQLGVAKLAAGFHTLTYPEAVELVEKMQRLSSGVRKHLQPRYRACMGSVCNAFGPEFWERHVCAS